MMDWVQELSCLPARAVADLSSQDVPLDPGIYAWYRNGRLFYVGESHRGLRSRIWNNHLRGNARSSTLRNKVAKALSFASIGNRKYGEQAEKEITRKLEECEIRYLAIQENEIDSAQRDLIVVLDPPMNDHPGDVPRWRIDDVREILAVTPQPTRARAPVQREEAAMSTIAESQRVTLADIRAGRIRFPREAKRYFPTERESIQVVLRGVQLHAHYDPRTGPDRERSAVLALGKSNLEKLVRADETLSISLEDGTVRLD